MVIKPRHKRFDESFSVILTIIGLFVSLHLAISKSLQDQIMFTFVYGLSLLVWISGYLLGGEQEYNLKIYGLNFAITSVFGLLGASLIVLCPDVIFFDILLGDLFAIIIAPSISLACSLFFTKYLKASIPNINRTRAMLFLIFALYVIVTGYQRILYFMN